MLPDGTFTVDTAKIAEAVTALTREIMTLQAEGSYAKARAMIDKMGVVRPDVQKLLDRLTAVPVDIEPQFTTAATLGALTTAAAMSGRSLMIASTPQSSRRVMSGASSTVHTFTATPARCACPTKRRLTTVVAPERSGTWNS